MPGYAQADKGTAVPENAGVRVNQSGHAAPARPVGTSTPGLDAIQAMFDQSDRVQSLAATAQLLNAQPHPPPPARRSDSAVAQRVIQVGNAPVTAETIRTYNAYKILPADEKVRLDQQFQTLNNGDGYAATDADALIAELQRLDRIKSVVVDGQPVKRVADIRKYKAYKQLKGSDKDLVSQQFVVMRDAGGSAFANEDALIKALLALAHPEIEQALDDEAADEDEDGSNSEAEIEIDGENIDEKKQEKLPANVIFREANAKLLDDLPGTFRIASFDDTAPLTFYRFVSSKELDELQQTIQSEKKPVFKNKGNKSGEKFFGVNKRYVWNAWKGKGKRAQQAPALLKVVLKPGVRAAFLHNAKSAGLSDSAKGVYKDLGKLPSIRRGDQKPINIKSESVKGKMGETSLTYGFRGSADDNSSLETLADHIMSVEIVTGEELAALDNPKTKWTQIHK